MQRSFTISHLALGQGWLGICPVPGRYGGYERDFAAIKDWNPDLVVSMTEHDEMEAVGAGAFGPALQDAGIIWHHFPIRDFGAPNPTIAPNWPEISAQARGILANNGKVLAHCKGGCGRSGMVLLRLMVEHAEDPETALARLRQARPCAVETDAQRVWAFAGEPA